jgi:hypothetical protein
MYSRVSAPQGQGAALQVVQERVTVAVRSPGHFIEGFEVQPRLSSSCPSVCPQCTLWHGLHLYLTVWKRGLSAESGTLSSQATHLKTVTKQAAP